MGSSDLAESYVANFEDVIVWIRSFVSAQHDILERGGKDNLSIGSDERILALVGVLDRLDV